MFFTSKVVARAKQGSLAALAKAATGFLLACLFAALWEASSLHRAIADESRRLAFVVGINEYDNLGDQKQLTRAVRDADDVASKLRELGFTVVSDVGRNIERDAFTKKWKDFVDQVDPKRHDTIAIFMSGHGVEIEGESYFLTKNAPYVRAGRSEETKREGISLREMIRDLEPRKAKIALMLVDACRTNPFLPREFTVKGLGGTSFTGDGVLIVYSAGGNETALDRLPILPADSNPNSVFTRALLPMLDSLKASSEPLYRAWFQTLRNKVRGIAASAGKEQSPKAYSGLEGEFCLLNSCAEDVKLLPNLERDPNRHEIIYSADEGVLLDYVSRYRGSESAREAEYRIAELVRARSTLQVISVGIGQHRDPRLPVLHFSGIDARDISQVVRERMGPLYKEVKIHTLIDDQASRASITEAFAEISSSAKPSDTLIVYLTGHVWSANNRGYLVPADADLDRISTLVSLDEIQERVAFSFGRVLLLVDACGITYGQPVKNLLDKSRDSQLTVLSASVPDGIAFEIQGLDRSAFAYALIQGLSGKAARPQQTWTPSIPVGNPTDITVRNLAQFIEREVKGITGGKQTPYFMTTDEDFVLAQQRTPVERHH
jgi:uncharacterized caspase-like protein